MDRGGWFAKEGSSVHRPLRALRTPSLQVKADTEHRRPHREELSRLFLDERSYPADEHLLLTLLGVIHGLLRSRLRGCTSDSLHLAEKQAAWNRRAGGEIGPVVGAYVV
jgi:hypothetical protein